MYHILLGTYALKMAKRGTGERRGRGRGRGLGVDDRSIPRYLTLCNVPVMHAMYSVP